MMYTTIFALFLFASPAAAQVGQTWDKKFTGANRFIVLTVFGSQAVFDKETGLVWERAPSTDTSLRQRRIGIAITHFWEIVSGGVFRRFRNWRA
jgi:hypothetical protein